MNAHGVKMIGSVTQSTDFGFGRLMPQGREVQPTGELSPDQQHQVDQLKATDRKVRAHEQAHMAAGGDLVLGGAAYSYQAGPDGRRYAVGGEVSIDISAGKSPEETISKAEHIREAAPAPADPSPQDRRVAAYASQMEMQARQELAQKAIEERAHAGSERDSQAIAAYQTVGGLERSAGFSAEA